MLLKVFKLENGELRYVGIREVRQGDIILEGDTSTIHLAESRGDSLIVESLNSLSDEEKANVKRGLVKLGLPDPENRAALVAAFKRLHPEWTEEQISIAVRGK